jgi:hypothetical protein
MANSKVTLKAVNPMIFDDPRHDLVMEAVAEIAELAQHIIEISGLGELVFRGLAARIKECNSSVMSAIGDDTENTDDLRHNLYRRHMARIDATQH